MACKIAKNTLSGRIWLYYSAYDIPIIMDRGSNRRLSHG